MYALSGHNRCLVTHKVYKYERPPNLRDSTTTTQTANTEATGHRRSSRSKPDGGTPDDNSAEYL